MAIPQHCRVVGVFEDRFQARRAIEELQRQFGAAVEPQRGDDRLLASKVLDLRSPRPDQPLRPGRRLPRGALAAGIGAGGGGLVGLLVGIMVEIEGYGPGMTALLVSVIGGIAGSVCGFVMGAGTGPEAATELDADRSIDVATVSVAVEVGDAVLVERVALELGAVRAFRAPVDRVPDIRQSNRRRQGP